MHTFQELLKKIREEACLTQAELAKTLGVSTILISMVETGQKEPSKNLLLKLAKKMRVHPSSITPFLFSDNDQYAHSVTGFEKRFINFGEKIQHYLIKDRARLLRRHAKN